MLPWQLRGAVRIQAVEMAKGGRSSSKRSLSRPKKRKYYGKLRSAPRDDPVEHEDIEESLENSECGSSSASKLRTLPSLRTPCTPVDVYDQSSTSASAASRDSSSCSETECSEGDDDDDDDDDDDEEVDSDSSTWSDDDGCDSELSGNRVVNMSCLSKLISEGCSCSRCGGRLVLHERSRWGIAPELTLTCSACERETSEVMSNKIGRYFEVNRRAVFAGRAVGLGREGLVKFCALMDMPPPMSNTSYQAHQDALLVAAGDVAQHSLTSAAATVREQAETEGSSARGDVAVTFDGTWMKRGHTSLYGVTTVISLSTGQVLDYEVCSKFCHACSRKRAAVAAGKMSAAEFADWQTTHDCSVTTEGSSGSMEVQGALAMWRRSPERQLRYLIFVGDGDCKAHKAVVESQPYGPTVEVQKEECVGHVQKRVGTRLRDLKKRLGGQKLSDGKPISGIGRLPDRMIDLLQTYFGMAVRSNTENLQNMTRATWAALMHKVQHEDPAKQHRFCPPGGDSWCGWQVEQAGGEQYTARDTLPYAVFEVIKPIWLQLTDKSLLEKCVRGATQNRNEAWNGMLWGICPKTKFAGADVVKLCAALTCLRFNNGLVSYLSVLEAMGMERGVFAASILAEQDRRRISAADRKATDRSKKARKRRRRVRKGLEDDIRAAEGVIYGPGIAD